jgi:PiT family inorganic phosphate transporter
VISPVMGGLIAAMFLAFIKPRMIYADDKIAAARRWVPVLVAIMAGAFSAYLALKGLSKVVRIGMGTALIIGAVIGLLVWAVAVPVVRRQSEGLENRKKSLKKLFALPLVVSAALLSFAHGANDVANAVGPLAAIVDALGDGHADAKVTIPLWVMMIGAAGISFGLLLFGPKLIRLVGSEITRLNAVRAFCVALSAAITVIVASALGLPVSSTHIAVGAIFGVGFYREWHAERRTRALGLVKGKVVAPEERVRRKLVRRSHLATVAAAWVITVPLTAVLAGLVFLALRALAG